MKRSDINVTLKTTFAKQNSEMEKLEKSKKAHLRMLTGSGAKIRMKQISSEKSEHPSGDIDAKRIKMYETHVPGFCYLRNGECRKRTTSTVSQLPPDPIQCSKKLKAILFTDNELDIQKTVCLHLLGTHVHSRAHIQRKNGRLCSYIKAQAVGNTPHTLQPFSQRVTASVNKMSSKYDKMLPRYILDIKVPSQEILSPSVKTYEFDSGSDEETKKKRKLQVPIYINNEIRMIIHSVMEALEAVNSSKLNDLINLASSPEELRILLKNEDLNEFINELSTRPLVIKPTSYDFVMTHLMFDKIPEKGTLEPVAQVLEIDDNAELQNSLCQIRKAILQRHTELVNSNIIPREKIGTQEKLSGDNSKITNPFFTSNLKQLETSNTTDGKRDNGKEMVKSPKKPEKNVNSNSKEADLVLKKDNSQEILKKQNSTNKLAAKSVSINLEKILAEDNACPKEDFNYEDTSLFDERRSFVQNKSSIVELNKYSFQNLSNPQRILFGLKVASLKCKPINMHQFEGKKKIDLTAILAPIIRPTEVDADGKQHLLQTQVSSLTAPEKKVKKSLSNISEIHTTDLENLTRALLANLRLEISETENKKRVNRFMETIS